MKGSRNYREAYLSGAEVSEEWHKLGQKPEVIRCAACVCVGEKSGREEEGDKSNEKEGGKRREISL